MWLLGYVIVQKVLGPPMPGTLLARDPGVWAWLTPMVPGHVRVVAGARLEHSSITLWLGTYGCTRTVVISFCLQHKVACGAPIGTSGKHLSFSFERLGVKTRFLLGGVFIAMYPAVLVCTSLQDQGWTT